MDGRADAPAVSGAGCGCIAAASIPVRMDTIPRAVIPIAAVRRGIGGNVLAGVLSGPAEGFFDRIRPYGMFILYGLLLSGILWQIVDPVQFAILRILGLVS